MQEQTLTLSDFIKKPFIFLKKEYQSKQELFEEIYQIAQEKKYVRDDFLLRITEREEEFPTGIQLKELGVAIPHTDPECVFEEFVAVITLKTPILFQRMDDKNQSTSVEVIFVLGLNQPHTQLTMLQTLMSLIQDTERMKKLLSIEDRQKMILLLNSLDD